MYCVLNLIYLIFNETEIDVILSEHWMYHSTVASFTPTAFCSGTCSGVKSQSNVFSPSSRSNTVTPSMVWRFGRAFTVFDPKLLPSYFKKWLWLKVKAGNEAEMHIIVGCRSLCIKTTQSYLSTNTQPIWAVRNTQRNILKMHLPWKNKAWILAEIMVFELVGCWKAAISW